VNRVDTLHGLQIAKRNFVGADSDNRTVRVKKILNRLALFQAHNVRREPEVADGGIPWAGNHTQRGEKKVVDSAKSEVEDQCREGKGEEAVREPERREMDRRANHRVYFVVVWGSKEKFQETRPVSLKDPRDGGGRRKRRGQCNYRDETLYICRGKRSEINNISY
jgi:hypothetical protein